MSSSVTDVGTRTSSSSIRPLTAPPRALRIYFAAMTASNKPELGLYYTSQNGNVAPAHVDIGSNTGLVTPTTGWEDWSGTWDFVWTCDATTNTISRFSAGTWGDVAPNATIGGSKSPMQKCANVAIAPNGDIVATDIAANAIYIWPSTARGNVAPITIISGPLTGLNKPSGIAFDPAGDIFISNMALPPNSSIEMFAAGASGNAEPMRLWQTPVLMDTLPAVAFDALHSLIFAVSGRLNTTSSVLGYDVSSGGTNVVPKVVIGGCKTLVSTPKGIAVDFAGYIYVASEPSPDEPNCAPVTGGILTFPPGVNGQFPPDRIIQGTNTGLGTVFQLRVK